MKYNLRRFALVAALTLLANAAVAQTASQPPGTQAIKLRGTVEAVDQTARTVRIRGEQGNVVTLNVPQSMTAFDRLRVGDVITVDYREGVALNVLITSGTAATPSAPVPVPDDDFRHRFTISVLWGVDNSFSGNMIASGSGELQGVPISLDEKAYDDVYGRMGLFKVGVGYRTSPRSEVVLDLVISRSSAEVVGVGTVGAANAPVTALFDDYNYWGFEGGQRFYFARTRFTPYVGYFVGINRFDVINADFSAPAVGTQPGVAIDNGQFFDKSWALSFGPRGGLLIGLGPIEVMGEVALRYMGGLSDVDPLTEAGLRDINDESSRWSIPVMVGARLRF